MTLETHAGGAWRKSSHSNGGGGNDCVEVMDLGESVAVRDSKDPDGPVLAVGVTAWRAFLQLHTSSAQ